MKTETFSTIVSETMSQCDTLLGVKEGEYSDGKDRLVQFKTAAALKGENPVEALTGMMVKHDTKLYLMLKELTGGKSFTAAQFDEVMNDKHNYLYLLKALLVDEGDI